MKHIQHTKMQTVVKDSAKKFDYERVRLGSNKGYKIYKVLRYLNLSLENFEFEAKCNQ